MRRCNDTTLFLKSDLLCRSRTRPVRQSASMNSSGVPQHKYVHSKTRQLVTCRRVTSTIQAIRTQLGARRNSNAYHSRSLVLLASGNGPSSGDSSSSSSRSRSPVLILPGFLSNNTTAPQSQYREMADNLLALGHPAAEILPASTLDWLPALSGASFKWYIQRLAQQVQQLREKHQQQVSLVGVSAGGWLARIALGRVPYHGEVWGLAPYVHTLVTCGTPHQSLEAYPFGRAEEAWLAAAPAGSLPDSITTSLQYTNHHYPDADSLQPTRIVCVIGNAVKGVRFDLAKVGPAVLTGQLRYADANDAWFVQSSYQANCGVVEVEGDGVCPLQTATIPGAETLVLPGVWHNATPGKLWYGSREVVEQWDKYLP